MALDFNPNEYDSADSLEPVPAGIYRVRVAKITAKPAFAAYDERRNYDIVLKITEGEHAGRPLLEFLTLHNGKSEDQVNYARSRLKNLMWAVYLERIDAVEELKDRECTVKAWIDEGLDKNGVKKFQRRNRFNYVIPADFTRPKPDQIKVKTNSAAEPQPAAANPLPDDDIPF